MARSDDRDEIEKIKQMKIQYTHYYDTGDLEGVFSLFTEDSTVDAGRLGSAEGIDEVRAFYHKMFEMTGRTLHIISNPIIELTGPDTAKGEWYLVLPMIGLTKPGESPLVCYGGYSDEYRKVDGEWKISAFGAYMELPHEWATAGESQGEG